MISELRSGGIKVLIGFALDRLDVGRINSSKFVVLTILIGGNMD
jgi:hypothetical protein